MKVLENLNFLKAWNELLPELLSSALLTVVIVTCCAIAIAFVLGFLMAMGLLSNNFIVKKIMLAVQEIIRGTPIIVQLLYMYFVVPLLIEIVAYFLGFPDLQVNLPAVTAGTLALGINYGTYFAEIIRSAILAIDNGQTEAALALGFSPLAARFRIVIPQALRNSIPVFGNYVVMMVKDTSLLAYIAVPEFITKTKTYNAQTFLTIESYTILAMVYLMICIPLSGLVKILERSLNKHRR